MRCLWSLLGAVLLVGAALLFVETVITIVSTVPCECDTDTDCMMRCGGDGSYGDPK